MKSILEIKNISKKFNIAHKNQSYLSIRDSIYGLIKTNKKWTEDFWALKDVSFDVYPGESIGILGKNGAGKSTLLKILSKITPPTSGKIISRGRIASLLEVGTGFHPELTGRENIFLNGSILGMKKREIQNKFDAIINFSGVEKFLDTPLKHYSSGMQLRLAFAVAAFLEPEILVIDEVLAVGDAEFQRKCMLKMNEVSKNGRTILFVSHNLSAIEALCNRAILLNKGTLIANDNVSTTINNYIGSFINTTSGLTNGQINFDATTNKTNLPHISKVEMYCNEKLSSNQYMGSNMELKVYFHSQNEFTNQVLGISIKDSQNIPIIGINSQQYIGALNIKPIKQGCISIKIPNLQLMHGTYSADLFLGTHTEDLDVIYDAFSFTVDERDFNGTGNLPLQKLNKFFIKNVEWRLEAV